MYKAYMRILEEELLVAMGCTEPIALAYAAAKARDVLNARPDKVLLQVSGSIIKNAKSVVVPNTGHMKGIVASVAAGIIAGKTEKKLEVLSEVSEKDICEISKYIENTVIKFSHSEDGPVFEIIVNVFKDNDYAKVRISDHHTNITLIESNGETLYRSDDKAETKKITADRSLLSIENIWEFAMSVDTDDVKDILEKQIEYNCAIANEGLTGDYGANIGKVLINTYGENSVAVRAKAMAAAGSDARMSGCEMPVIINSGSGNQGIVCSVPVAEYAKELKSSPEQLLRALVISNLTAIHAKTAIGILSAYCGAVSAGVGAAAGISYLLGGGYDEYIHTVSNAFAISSGIICDGAKPSCAAKIAISLDSAFLAHSMFGYGREFKAGDGLVCSDIEATISNIGRLGSEGMKCTNESIIDMMIVSD